MSVKEIESIIKQAKAFQEINKSDIPKLVSFFEELAKKEEPKEKPKPTKAEILALAELKNQLDSLYEKKRGLEAAFFKKYGETVVSVELDTPDEEGHKYLRMKIIDQSEALKRGETIYRPVGFNETYLELKYLKREPKNED